MADQETVPADRRPCQEGIFNGGRYWIGSQPARTQVKVLKNMEATRYMTVEEAAAYIRVSRWTIYKLIERRKVPFISISTENSEGDRQRKAIVRFDTQALDKWLAKQAVAPPF